MIKYKTPIEDYLFLLHDFLEIEKQKFPGFSELNPQFTRSILEGSGNICERVLSPLNQPGDAEGARLVDGKLHAPAGFAEAFAQYRDAGWSRAGIAESIGGLGFPSVITGFTLEMLNSANPAFGMYLGFCTPASGVLSRFGPAWISQHVVPHIVAGNWSATMCLTEAHCGTDLRLMKTRATVQDDGTYRISGTKIFISGAENAFVDNIAHLVLAKLPDSEGRYTDDFSAVNFFLVSKRVLDPETGSLGGPNGVSVSSIEKKMGLKASATCVLNFDDAVAWRLMPRDVPSDGVPGMVGMFEMMNFARLGTGAGAIGIAEIACQSAASYARERMAGRALGKRVNPALPADPLIAQPDVRRLILESMSFVEGARAAVAWASFLESVEAFSDDPAERERAADLLHIFTPVFKAYFTDKSSETTNACLQVFGGHGYVSDYGMEQHVRDVRVSQIYEGANGVQAFDFAVRRLRAKGGRGIATFLSIVDEFLVAERETQEMEPYIRGLSEAAQHFRATLNWIESEAGANNEEIAAVSYDVLTQAGITVLAFVWARVAQVALKKRRTDGETPFLERKLALAALWMERQVPLCQGLAARVRMGSGSLMALDAELI